LPAAYTPRRRPLRRGRKKGTFAGEERASRGRGWPRRRRRRGSSCRTDCRATIPIPKTSSRIPRKLFVKVIRDSVACDNEHWPKAVPDCRATLKRISGGRFRRLDSSPRYRYSAVVHPDIRPEVVVHPDSSQQRLGDRSYTRQCDRSSRSAARPGPHSYEWRERGRHFPLTPFEQVAPKRKPGRSASLRSRPSHPVRRPRGAKPPRRGELLEEISLLSPEYLLSDERPRGAKPRCANLPGLVRLTRAPCGRT
jgi:hypothetical protein